MSRGPVPNKPANRPTVPEVAAKLREYRKLPGRYAGGCVHVIVDDPNYGQGTADSCLENAEQWSREWGAGDYLSEDVEIATLIASLTVTQRRKLAGMDTYPS